MSYSIDKKTHEIVINGPDQGIAPDPYEGISDMRNMNIISVPKEASVNFSTAKNSYVAITGSVVSADASTDVVTVNTGTFENRMSIVFAGGSLPTGIVAGTVYWVNNVVAGVEFKLYTDQALTSLVDISSTGTGTYTTLDMAKPVSWAYDPVNIWYFVADSSGRVWGTNKLTTSGAWTYTGNTTLTNAHGRGLCVYVASDGSGTLTSYLFVFRNSRIDYTATLSISWVYAWAPASGSTGVDALVTPAGTNNSHQCIVGQDNVMYWCDSSFIGSVFQKAANTAFDPTNPTTYTYAKQALALPTTDLAQCLTELGINLMVGGIRNVIYPWNRTSTSFSYPILLAEYNIQQMVTVNTNTFIFVGNRGRIWITNGTQAQLYKKIPDHLSGTVEPYFTWGGATSIKNQLFFGIQATTNAGVANNNYGGVWAIDLDTKGIRLTNQLSYGTYAGLASLVFPIFTATPAGTGLYIGWDSGASTFGIDATSSTPYTNYQPYIDTDNIPIGTFLVPYTPVNVEFKLATPMVAGEGIKISYRLKFSDAFTLIWENTTAGTFSDEHSADFQNAQWVQFRIETKSTAISPSYVRWTEMRVRSLT